MPCAVGHHTKMGLEMKASAVFVSMESTLDCNIHLLYLGGEGRVGIGGVPCNWGPFVFVVVAGGRRENRFLYC